MKRFIHPIGKSAKTKNMLEMQEAVLQENDPTTREHKLFKAMNSLMNDPSVVNSYKVTRLGRDFKIIFNDGRKLTWNIDSLPVDWLDILWEYGTCTRRVDSLPVGHRLPGESGSFFDSKASTSFS